MIVWNKIRSSVFCLGYVSHSCLSLYCVTSLNFIECSDTNSFCHIQRIWLLSHSTAFVTFNEYCHIQRVLLQIHSCLNLLNTKSLHIDFCCSSQSQKFSELCHRWSGLMMRSRRWMSQRQAISPSPTPWRQMIVYH